MILNTVGHGTLTADAFAELLRRAGVAAVVDVRRHPGSRRHPHFASEAMARWLAHADIGYRWDERLGGRRHGRPDSPHTGLRDASFRAYADHMTTPAFRAALTELLAQARGEPTAVMCSESVWWRCHRRLIADVATLAHGVAVRHLLHDGRLDPHVVTDVARLAGGGVVYDRAAQGDLLGGGRHD